MWHLELLTCRVAILNSLQRLGLLLAEVKMLATRCQHRGPEVDKFERVSSSGHQMSLAEGGFLN